jgi:DNA-binding response OmpR family regulator
MKMLSMTNPLSQNDPPPQKISGDILIIDDTPATLRFLADLLNKAGYIVRKVTSGEQGLAIAQLEPPDLILLDVKMPGLDGYRVCDQLKSNARTREIPIIFLSAMHEELDKVLAFEAGGVDYITKPFQIVEVLARIETHLQVSRLRQKLQQQNIQLQREIEQRISAETALGHLNQGLDTGTHDQTSETQAPTQQVLDSHIELQQALAQEKHYNEVKSQAITIIAEKLTPAVTVIATAVELLKNSEQERSIQENQQLQTILDNTRLIQQVLQEALALIEPAS